MKALRVVCWILVFAMLCAMALLIKSPSIAEVKPIDEDITACGYPPIKSGWISETEYQDESIHVTIYEKMRKPKSASQMTTCRWILIDIADPSQLRTAISNDSYDDPSVVSAASMSRAVSAVVAMNGDSFKYDYGIGYVMRQGTFYRDALDGTLDCLIIDDHGDLHGVRDATSESLAAAMSDLEADGRRSVNVFTFGPILAENGQVRDPLNTDLFAGYCSTQRIALVQLGPLSYAIVEIDADEGYGTGMTMTEFARYIVELFPDCIIAYNFDGGGSTHLLVNSKAIHLTPSGRAVSDIIYFASAQVPED